MAFLSLANEIIIQVIEHLEDQPDIYSATRVNRRFYHLFIDYLYRYNIQFRGSSALLWAAEHGRESTARRLLYLGADVDVKVERSLAGPLQLIPSSITDTREHCGISLLHFAARKGHIAIVKILLECGANPEARTERSWTPLYISLASGHEKIGRTIAMYISDLRNCLVDSERNLTPLHVASSFGLSNFARYALERGADVNVRDGSERTPLYHALKRDYRFETIDTAVPSHDKILETVKVLLEFGANPDIEIPTYNIWGEPITARKLALCHLDCRVRALFKSDIGVSRLQIGRTWMLSLSLGTTRGESSEPELGIHMIGESVDRNQRSFEPPRLSIQCPDDDPWQPGDLDDELFPTLGVAKTSTISKLQTHLSNDPWSTSNVDRLLAGFSIATKSEVLPTPEPLTKADPFPQLSDHRPKNLLGDTASNLWANFRKPRNDTVTEDVFTNSSNLSPVGMKNSVLGSRRTKVRGKGRWQPLIL